jgi:hypothetical protein
MNLFDEIDKAFTDFVDGLSTKQVVGATVITTLIVGIIIGSVLF